jgi:ribose 5-phosphate isomerase B
MRIAIAADHNAVSMKSRLGAWLNERGHQIDDRGVNDPGEIADYPRCAPTSGSE